MGGGTIAGVVTRVSNGATISGALVEAIQGSSVVASATTNSSGNYLIGGLSAGIYTVRASFTGLVPQMHNNVGVSTANTTTVDLSLNFGIAVQSPVAGDTINDFSVLVTGLFDTPLVPEVGITVNGYIALIDGDEFAAFVPIDSQTTTLTATIANTAGTSLATDVVPITPQLPSTEPVLNFRPAPVIAFVTQSVSLTLTSLNPISQVQLDANGDGAIDFTGTTLDGASVTFAEPGIYFPSVTATDYIVKSKRTSYQNVFNSLPVPFANIDQVLGNITYAGQNGLNIEYEMLRQEGADLISYMVLFCLDEDGVWRIKFF